MDNLFIYNACREVPKEAQRPINAGRLKGMTDINPQWRIQKLTEMFGPEGLGWSVETVRKWVEDGANGEKCAFTDIKLYVKFDGVDGEWSRPIEGTGGSMLVTQERNGLHTSDEAFKMARTDAISVACKELGMGADVYWQQGRTKYNNGAQEEPKPAQPKLKAAAQAQNSDGANMEKVTRLVNMMSGLSDNGASFMGWVKKKWNTDDLSKLNDKQLDASISTLKNYLENAA